jgi:hypothetical protein
LEDTTDGAFRYFVQWIYRQKLTLDTHQLDWNSTDDCDDEFDVECDDEFDVECDDEFDVECDDEPVCLAQEKALLELWVLAEKLLVP